MSGTLDRLEAVGRRLLKRYRSARQRQRSETMSKAVREARDWAAGVKAPVFALEDELVGGSSIRHASVLIGSRNQALQGFVLIVHKGKLREVSVELWEYLAGRSTTPFSNDVFIAFEAADVRSAPDSQKSFYIDGVSATGGTVQERAADGRLRVYVGNSTILTETGFRRKIFVDADDIELTPHLVADGTWERWVGDFMRRELHEGDHFMDIGANCGYFSLLGADIVGSAGAVVAVEPVTKLRTLVGKSFQVNGFSGFAHVEAAALSSESGTTRIYIHPERKGSSSLWNATWDKFEEIQQRTFEEVLDNASRALGRPFSPRFIKMDIEGNEYHAWRGMRDWATRATRLTMILEFSPSNYQSLSQDPVQFFDEILAAGFAVTRLMHDGSEVAFSRNDVPTVPNGSYVDLVLRK